MDMVRVRVGGILPSMLLCTHGNIGPPVSCALSGMNYYRMARILPTTWNVDFALVDERENANIIR